MTETIAVAGKGGTGKTTLCGLLVRYLADKNQSPILAVDADANSNLNEVLGVEIETTLGAVRERVVQDDGLNDDMKIPGGMNKREYMEYKMGSAVAEEDDFDMIVMGRTEGKGCYCFVNDLLQAQLEKLVKNYKYIVVDNEAGMEHISRGTLPSMDILLLVSDCSRRGIQAVGRIARLAEEIGIAPEVVKLIVNRAPSKDLAEGIMEEIALQGLDLIGVVPQDDLIYDYDTQGKPTSTLPASSKARQAADAIFKELLGF